MNPLDIKYFSTQYVTLLDTLMKHVEFQQIISRGSGYAITSRFYKYLLLPLNIIMQYFHNKFKITNIYRMNNINK